MFSKNNTQYHFPNRVMFNVEFIVKDLLHLNRTLPLMLRFKFNISKEIQTYKQINTKTVLLHVAKQRAKMSPSIVPHVTAPMFDWYRHISYSNDHQIVKKLRRERNNLLLGLVEQHSPYIKRHQGRNPYIKKTSLPHIHLPGKKRPRESKTPPFKVAKRAAGDDISSNQDINPNVN